MENFSNVLVKAFTALSGVWPLILEGSLIMHEKEIKNEKSAWLFPAVQGRWDWVCKHCMCLLRRKNTSLTRSFEFWDIKNNLSDMISFQCAQRKKQLVLCSLVSSNNVIFFLITMTTYWSIRLAVHKECIWKRFSNDELSSDASVSIECLFRWIFTVKLA